METDISAMSDNARFDPAPLNEYQDFQQASPQYHQPQYDFIPPQHQQHYVPTPQPPKKNDFFADIDKKAWIFILIALILGFFMGKTMQPIILRSV